MTTTAPETLHPAASSPQTTADAIARSRRAHTLRWLIVVTSLALMVAALYLLSLMVGNTFYSPAEIARVVAGEQVPGASFAVGHLRLPRASTALLVGAAFGIAGVTFQTLLRNALASPDIIGISSGASAAAVFGIVVLGLGDGAVSLIALAGALLTSAAIFLLSHRGGFGGTRLILIGIGVGAMLNAVTTFVLSTAAAWDLQAAMRWITGSLNTASWSTLAPLALGCAAIMPVLLLRGSSLSLLRMGDDLARGLGVAVSRDRIVLLAGAVSLLAIATAAAGPIAFVAFMAGPIAARLVRPGAPLLLPAALVGALLVLGADLIGQFAFDTRYPVGVITGALGAPFLIALLIRTNRAGGSL